ncbi:MAG TPA: nuclear transport factor 2 family protein [Chitinophagaceae bacterium]|nr:nuclear transport factor 2 family protein [Chitinophagaceae bacterium]
MKPTFVKVFAFSLALLLGLAAISQVSHEDSIKYAKQLIGMEQQLMDDIPSGSIIHWDAYLNKDFFVITEDGSMLDKKTLLETFQPMPKGYSGHINVIKPKIVFHGNTAVIQYVSDEFENVFKNKIHTQYSSMNTYIKSDTSWQMISSQVFEIPLLPPAIKVPVSVLKQYTGIYQLSDSNTCIISIERDTLYYQKSGRSKIALLPETENIFFRLSDARGRKLFVKDENGVMLMRERRNGQDVVWIRREKK